jgi:TrmH family RNA methyltransferase
VRLPVPSELDRLVIVLVRPRNPLNIGAAARAMANFGAHRLRLVNPYRVAFREARSAVGAAELLNNAQEFKTLAEAVSDCGLVIGTTAVRNRVLHHPVHRLDESAGAGVRQHLKAGPVAVLFGSEKIGLTNEDFSHCHYLLTIPTEKQHISMNLGQAVAVCMYEFARYPVESGSPERERAVAGMNEEITRTLLEALRRSEYVKPGTDASSEEKARRLVFRFNLDAPDATVLLGMMRQIVWRLRQSGKS